MGRIEWDVKDCMQSRQGYTIAVNEEERRQVVGRIAKGCKDARSFAELRGDVFWFRNTSTNMRNLEESRGKVFGSGGVAGGALTVTQHDV